MIKTTLAYLALAAVLCSPVSGQTAAPSKKAADALKAASEKAAASSKTAADKATAPAKAAAEKGTAVAEKAAAPTKTAAEKATAPAKAAAEKAEKAAAPAKKPATAAKPAAGGESDADKALRAHATKEGGKLSAAESTKLMDLVNKGADKELQTMPGIGEAKAAAIKKARPFKALDDLIMVDGIGEATFDGIIAWVNKGMPVEAPAEKKEAKPEPKSAAKEKAAEAKEKAPAAAKKATSKAKP